MAGIRGEKVKGNFGSNFVLWRGVYVECGVIRGIGDREKLPRGFDLQPMIWSL
jgi:hypothetical protein